MRFLRYATGLDTQTNRHTDRLIATYRSSTDDHCRRATVYAYSGSTAVVIDERPVTSCLSDIDSPAGGSKRFDWVHERRVALFRGRGEVCRLRLPSVFG